MGVPDMFENSELNVYFVQQSIGSTEMRCFHYSRRSEIKKNEKNHTVRFGRKSMIKKVLQASLPISKEEQ